MTELEDHQTETLPITALTAEIVGAYVGHLTVAATDLPVLIATVGQQLGGLSQAPAKPDVGRGKACARRPHQEIDDA